MREIHVLGGSKILYNLISRLFVVVNQSESKLPQQSSNAQSARNIYNAYTTANSNLDSKLSLMTAKFQILKALTAKVPFAIRYAQNGSSVHTMLGYSSSVSTLYNTIGFDMKTNASNGIVIYIFSQPPQMVSFFRGFFVLFICDYDIPSQ